MLYSYEAYTVVVLFQKNKCDSIQLFHACLVNSQNYATRCRGQLNEGHSFDYSAKQA